MNVPERKDLWLSLPNWRCNDIFTVKNQARAEIIEKKSRFIADVFPVSSKEEVDARINEIKKEYWDASHHVYAYILPGNISKFSDDGEPQGTAGLPMFTVLQKNEMTNVLCVVTRYFGGTLLGKGGLIRAYTEATKKALEKAEIFEIIKYSKVEFQCEYALKDKLLYFLEKSGIQYTSMFAEKVRMVIEIPDEKLQETIQNVIKLTENKIKYTILSK